jgi:phosphoglycolate phosphatase-like HAD superfamily hydrolase
MVSISPQSNGFHWLDADAYLFDIDGTLMRSKDGVHRNAIHKAMLEVYGIETTIDGIAYHGKTDLGILRAALARVGVSDQRFESTLPQALAVVRREVATNAHVLAPNVCAAIPEVLERLKSAGKLLGVASGNLESVGWQKVQTAGLRDYFTFGCFADQRERRSDIFRDAVTETRRRIGEQTAVCFVGDTPDDVIAARDAGASIIAVCTGIFTAQQLREYKPDLCIASCAELVLENSRA